MTTSQITTPTGPVFAMYDNTTGAPQTFNIAGTSNGTGDGSAESTGDWVDIRCFYIVNHQRASRSVASAPVDASGNFSVNDVSLDQVTYSSHSCVLRAVPSGTNSDGPAFLSDFAGPSMHVGRLNDKPAAGSNWWSVEQTQPKGRMHWRPASDCGMTSRPYSGGTDYASFYWPFRPWDCAAALYDNDGFSSSEIIVDGHYGYDPYRQQSIGASSAVDFDSWTSQVDPANGNLTITETGKIMRCVDGSTPANAVDNQYGNNCTAFVPTGVTRERTIVQDHEGQVATVTDKWISNDNAAHKVQLGYDNSSYSCGDDFNFYYGYNCYFGGGIGVTNTSATNSSASNRAAPRGAASAEDTPQTTSCYFGPFEFLFCVPNPDPTKYKLPGETEYKTHSYGETVEGLAAAPATVNVQVADQVNDHAYGSMTYTTAPNAIVWRGNNDFVARYTRDIPADGTLTLTHIYGQAPTAAGIGVLGTAAEDQQAGPAVTITAPPNGSTVKTANPTITGTATDNVGVTSLTVNGVSVPVNADGTWSTNAIKLTLGSNTITAIAKDAQGNTAQAQSIVIYKPAAAKKCKVPNVKGKSLAKARAAIKKAGCVVGKVKAKTSKKVKPGHVISQGKKAGTRVAIATRVNLTIAKPKPAKRRHVSPSFTG